MINNKRTCHGNQTNLPEDKRFFVIDGIKSVVWHSASPELLAYRVRRQPIHVYLNVRTHLLIRQKLAGDNLMYTHEYKLISNKPNTHQMHGCHREMAAKYKLWKNHIQFKTSL